MASLAGYNPGGVQFIATGAPQGDATNPIGVMDNIAAADGTPLRVVVLALSAAAGLYALRVAGFKFNVGVSTS